ncbi:hypothetical protein BH11PSE3_BH11PSE3_05320 [soil metagenome]
MHLAAVLLAAVVLWLMRDEITEKAVTGLEWMIAPVLAIAVAAVLLIASPGKRFELWLIAIIVGLGLGALMAATLKINRDVGQRLMRVQRAWDGVAAAALLFSLAVVRLVTSDFLGRQSGKFGVLGAGAAFLAAYLVGRFVVARFYRTPKSSHLDMLVGHNPRRTVV